MFRLLIHKILRLFGFLCPKILPPEASNFWKFDRPCQIMVPQTNLMNCFHLDAAPRKGAQQTAWFPNDAKHQGIK